MPELADAAPAQPTEPTPEQHVVTSAADAAVASDDVSAFRAAREAERRGKPLDFKPDSEAPADPSDPAAAAPPARELSNRQKADNERTRRAVEQATADLQAELTRLRAQLQPAQPRREAQPADADPEPNPDDATTYPDGIYDKAYIRDAARWNSRQEWSRLQIEQQQRAEAEGRTRTVQERDTAYRGRLAQAAEADPEFWKGISPEVLSLRRSAYLADDEPAGPLNAIADYLEQSELAPQLMKHLSNNPAELARLARYSPFILVKELGRLEGRLEPQAEPAAPAPKLVPDVPAPPTTVGRKASDPTDPEEAAWRSGDQAAFSRARLAKRIAAART